jgi:hypothetical protein
MHAEIGFHQTTTHSLRSALIEQMAALATERLADLWSLSFDELSRSEPEPLQVAGSWGAKGRLRTDVRQMEDGTLRVKVQWEVRFWWWPGYHEAHAGFYRERFDGSTTAVNFSSSTL